MTKDYLVNPCQMSINYYSGNNFEAYRKALIGEAFIMFLGFFLSQLYRAILKRQNQSNICLVFQKQPKTRLLKSRAKTNYHGMREDGTRCSR